MKDFFKQTLLIITTVLLTAPTAHGQHLQASLNLLLGQPQNEFQDNVEDLGFGLGGNFGYHFGTSPIMLGAEIQYMIYGSQTRREPFNDNIPDVTVEVETSNNILLFHLLARLQSPTGTFRPYLDGLFGMNYFFTETSVRDEDVFGEPIASSTNQDDAALSYGAGGGVMLRVYYSQKPETGRVKLNEVLIDFRIRYLFGGEATYLKEGSITVSDGAVEIDARRSRTDLLTYQLGVSFNF
jgi:hypothetical protein